MKSCGSTSIILNLLALSATTRAAGNWTYDLESCGLQGSIFVAKEWIVVRQSAIKMRDNLNAPSQTTDTLVQYMFGTAQQDYDPISFPQVVFGGGGTDNILGLANFAALPTTADLGDGDFKIFCDISRFIPPAVQYGSWYDPYSRRYWTDEVGQLQACLDGNPTPAGSPPPNAIRTISANGVSGINFCGWYIKRAMAALYPDGSNFNSNFFSRMRAWWGSNQPRPAGYAEIDIFKLFDGTFMHEVIHTPAAGLKRDVAGAASYRWYNCRILSTNTDPITGCQDNDDSHVELSLANKVSGYGYTVNEDGSLSY